MEIDNPSNYPDPQRIDYVEEPYVKASIIVPNDYVGTIMELCQGKRGEYLNMEYLDTNRVTLTYEIPLSEIVYDFFDQLKSGPKGYASFDYELSGYKTVESGENGYFAQCRASGCTVLHRSP